MSCMLLTTASCKILLVYQFVFCQFHDFFITTQKKLYNHLEGNLFDSQERSNVYTIYQIPNYMIIIELNNLKYGTSVHYYT